MRDGAQAKGRRGRKTVLTAHMPTDMPQHLRELVRSVIAALDRRSPSRRKRRRQAELAAQDEFRPRFTLNPADDGPLLLPILGEAAAELDARIAAARDALDELEACLAALEHKLHADADRAHADEALEGLGYVVVQLAAETADLGRRRDEMADWLARCRQPAGDLRFRPRPCFSHPEIRLVEVRAELARPRTRIVAALRHRASGAPPRRTPNRSRRR